MLNVVMYSVCVLCVLCVIFLSTSLSHFSFHIMMIYDEPLKCHGGGVGHVVYLSCPMMLAGYARDKVH